MNTAPSPLPQVGKQLIVFDFDWYVFPTALDPALEWRAVIQDKTVLATC